MAVHILIFSVLSNVKRLEKRANRINGEWGLGVTDKVQMGLKIRQKDNVQILLLFSNRVAVRDDLLDKY